MVSAAGPAWPVDDDFEEIQPARVSANSRPDVEIVGTSGRGGAGSLTIGLSAEIMERLGWAFRDRLSVSIAATPSALVLRLAKNPESNFQLAEPARVGADGKARSWVRIAGPGGAAVGVFKRRPAEFRVDTDPSRLLVRVDVNRPASAGHPAHTPDPYIPDAARPTAPARPAPRAAPAAPRPPAAPAPVEGFGEGASAASLARELAEKGTIRPEIKKALLERFGFRASDAWLNSTLGTHV